MNRPTLIPGLPRVWRGANELQLGSGPPRAVLLRLPDPRAAQVLDLLDGTRSERAIEVEAAERGIPPAETRTLLAMLEAAGLALPAAALLPATFPAQTRDRLIGEAAALALHDLTVHTAALRFAPGLPHPSRRNASRGRLADSDAVLLRDGPQPPGTSQGGTVPLGTGRSDSPTPEPTSSEAMPSGSAETPTAPSGADQAQHGRPDSGGTAPHGPGRSDPAGPGPGRAPVDRRDQARAGQTADSPARTLRRRAAARVVVTGRGRLGAAISVALAEAGVGHVQPELGGLVVPGELAAGPLRMSDVGRPRREAIVAAIAGVAPEAGPHGSRRESPSIVVQLDHAQPVSLVAAAHAARRLPHLAVTIKEGVAVIGPFVPAAGAPCLNCLDLHRRDRDADWPGPPVPNAPMPCTVTTLLAATAYATAEVLTFLDGGTPETLGASVEISAPGRIRRRTWPPHPDCPCARPRPAVRPAHGGEA